MFDHQLTAIYNLEKLEKEQKTKVGNCICETVLGVFGDMPGAGKTLSICGLLARDKMEWNLKEPLIRKIPAQVNDKGLFTCYELIKWNKWDCDLIVCSPSIINQWEEELSNTKLSIYTISKPKDYNVDPDDYNIILVSSNHYNDFLKSMDDKYQVQKAWRRFIYDEATSNHIKSMRSVTAGFYWFITATYQGLKNVSGKNHMINLIFRNIGYNILETLLIKSPDDYIRQSFKCDDPEIITYKCKIPKILKVIQNHVSADILTMISAGDVKGAIRMLGGDEEKNNANIVDLLVGKKQKDIDEAEMKIKLYVLHKNDKLVKEWTEKYTKLKEQLKDIEDRFKESLKDCCICMDEMKNPVLLPCCQNIFCKKCVNQINSNCNIVKCPLCRRENKYSDLITINTKSSSNKKQEKEEKRKTKQEIIVDIVKSDKTKKFIIFSSYDESFKNIIDSFKKNKIEYKEVKGRISTREKNIEDFKKGNVNILLLNSKFNGAGINLQCATDIILYHHMDEYIEKQVIGRVKRIGKVGKFRVHKLLDMDDVKNDTKNLFNPEEFKDDEEIEIEEISEDESEEIDDY